MGQVLWVLGPSVVSSPGLKNQKCCLRSDGKEGGLHITWNFSVSAITRTHLSCNLSSKLCCNPIHIVPDKAQSDVVYFHLCFYTCGYLSCRGVGFMISHWWAWVDYSGETETGTMTPSRDRTRVGDMRAGVQSWVNQTPPDFLYLSRVEILNTMRFWGQRIDSPNRATQWSIFKMINNLSFGLGETFWDRVSDWIIMEVNFHESCIVWSKDV